MEGGERFPLLVTEDGLPLDRPTEWMVTDRRPANVATNTLQANCFALKFLYLWADSNNLDVEARMLLGDYLRPYEINSLCAMSSSTERFSSRCRKPRF